MKTEGRTALAAELAAWMPEGVPVYASPPDTAAPPFVYLRDRGHSFRQGIVQLWAVVAVVDGGRSPADRAAELDQLGDLILAAVAKVAVLAECTSQGESTHLLGDVGNPSATYTVPMFHATCELPQVPPAALTAVS